MLGLAAGLLVPAVGGAEAGRFEFVWPTPSKAWAENRPASEWLQHAGSGDPATGGFGGVRSAGTKFHEGIDIRPVARDRQGAPRDPVFAAMPGVVRHVSRSPGGSGYGRYVVLEHPAMSPAVYTLYAHLARIGADVRVGSQVAAGQELGTMGHSSGGYMIPAARGHLHFEIGVALTRDFQTWYERRRYGSRNEHGMWNGMNLLGVDPIAFANEWKAGRLATAQDFFSRLHPVVRLRIATYRTPDFVTRYPSLLTKPLPLGPVGGWEVCFNWTGLPFAWTPLTTPEVAGLPHEKPRLVEVDAAADRRERSRNLAVRRGNEWSAGRDLEPVLQLLFGR